MFNAALVKCSTIKILVKEVNIIRIEGARAITVRIRIISTLPARSSSPPLVSIENPNLGEEIFPVEAGPVVVGSCTDTADTRIVRIRHNNSIVTRAAQPFIIFLFCDSIP